METEGRFSKGFNEFFLSVSSIMMWIIVFAVLVIRDLAFNGVKIKVMAEDENPKSALSVL